MHLVMEDSPKQLLAANNVHPDVMAWVREPAVGCTSTKCFAMWRDAAGGAPANVLDLVQFLQGASSAVRGFEASVEGSRSRHEPFVETRRRLVNGGQLERPTDRPSASGRRIGVRGLL